MAKALDVLKIAAAIIRATAAGGSCASPISSRTAAKRRIRTLDHSVSPITTMAPTPDTIAIAAPLTHHWLPGRIITYVGREARGALLARPIAVVGVCARRISVLIERGQRVGASLGFEPVPAEQQIT
jgi:hypothetical protein